MSKIKCKVVEHINTSITYGHQSLGGNPMCEKTTNVVVSIFFLIIKKNSSLYLVLEQNLASM